LTHNLSLIDINRKYLSYMYIFISSYSLLFLPYGMFKTKKNTRRECTYAQRITLAYQTAVIVHRVYNYCHVACMHKVSTFLFLLVRYAFERSLLFFSLLLFPCYMRALLRHSFLFFFSVFTCCTHGTCCNHFFVAHFVHSHFCL